MTDVLLLHHAQGLTEGVRAIADRIGAAGHTVHTPDLYDGHVFATLDEGLAYAKEQDFGAIAEAGVRAADGLPAELAVIGISMGVMAAQQLAQTRPGVIAAAFVASCLPVEEFGAWPAAVAVQVHGADKDPIFKEEGDFEAAEALVATAPDGELFLYPGAGHLYIDASLGDYEQEQADVTIDRILAMLDRVA